MSAFRPDRVRNDYKADIQSIRDLHGDDLIVDWIERYYASPDVDRDDVMEALDIDYVGTFYEMIRAYEVDHPKPDPCGRSTTAGDDAAATGRAGGAGKPSKTGVLEAAIELKRA